VLHHVIIRGIEGRNIFEDDRDRDNLLNRLGDVFAGTKTSCYAWAFLSNHAHFLVRTGTTSLSRVMARVLTGYVVTFNRRHLRHGPLFQNRFKSFICQEDLYFRELARYIHLNPLRAGIVSDLEHLSGYTYSGHSVLMGKRKCGWMDWEYVLSYFGETESKARAMYVSYMKEGIGLGRRPELVGGGLIRSLGGWEAVKRRRLETQERVKGDQRILGDSDFVLGVLRESGEKFEKRYEMKRLGYDLDRIEERVCEIFGIEKGAVFSRSRVKEKADARAVFCFWAARELGYGLRELGRKLGMTQPGVGYAVNRGERISKLNHYQLRK